LILSYLIARLGALVSLNNDASTSVERGRRLRREPDKAIAVTQHKREQHIKFEPVLFDCALGRSYRLIMTLPQAWSDVTRAPDKAIAVTQQKREHQHIKFDPVLFDCALGRSRIA
jgi:primosomal protein N''